MHVSPPTNLKNPLNVPYKTLMGPGPSNCSERVLRAMQLPVLGHLHPECLKIMDDIKEGIQYAFQTKNDVTLCISGSGHAGMEAAMCNLLEENDIALFGVTGLWAKRAADMAKRYGANVKYVTAEIGYSLTIEDIKTAFEKFKPKVFFVAQGDSSTGVLQQNLHNIGLLCRNYDILFVVDAVASLGGTEFYMDEWKIDVAYAGSQKVLGAPPGITPISFNDRAMSKIKCRKSGVRVYYFDIYLIGQYWKCFGDLPRIYHHTISANLLYGLREALAIFCTNEIRKSIARHKYCSSRLLMGIKQMGLELFVPNASDRLSTVNVIKVPEGLDWKKVSEYAMSKYSVEIAGGLGPTLNKVFRIGLMGENATIEKVDYTLEILKESIEKNSFSILKSKI